MASVATWYFNAYTLGYKLHILTINSASELTFPVPAYFANVRLTSHIYVAVRTSTFHWKVVFCPLSFISGSACAVKRPPFKCIIWENDPWQRHFSVWRKFINLIVDGTAKYKSPIQPIFFTDYKWHLFTGPEITLQYLKCMYHAKLYKCTCPPTNQKDI